MCYKHDHISCKNLWQRAKFLQGVAVICIHTARMSERFADMFRHAGNSFPKHIFSENARKHICDRTDVHVCFPHIWEHIFMGKTFFPKSPASYPYILAQILHITCKSLQEFRKSPQLLQELLSCLWNICGSCVQSEWNPCTYKRWKFFP